MLERYNRRQFMGLAGRLGVATEMVLVAEATDTPGVKIMKLTHYRLPCDPTN